MNMLKVITVVVFAFEACVCAVPDLSDCEVAAKTAQGYVCGKKRKANDGFDYASFRGIPYAKQPLGELRFKELQPAEPFDHIFDASETGPICPQVDVFYGSLMQPRSMSEDCIRINIHVPYQNLPDPITSINESPLCPVLVFIHGGSFSYGSGDADLYGPEYLVTKNTILVTFNYRLHAFGFFGMNNDYFPGNNGLRDAITALKWVQNNIKNFGGDPDRVTIGGQSAGAIMSHLLSLSPAAKGLFKQIILSSGQAVATFFSYKKNYMNSMNLEFLTRMDINPLLPPRKIHEKLVSAPLSKILEANRVLLSINGVTSFVPVIEEPHPNFTMVITKDPAVLIEEGVGKEYISLYGFCNNESETFRNAMVKANIETKLRLLPTLTVPTNVLNSAGPLIVPILTAMQLAKYFDGAFITLDKFFVANNDGSYAYVTQRLTLKRLAAGAEKTYTYQFAYTGENSPIKVATGQFFLGAGHVEDITYFFRVNSFLGPINGANELSDSTDDNKMKNIMTTCIANFVTTGSPVTGNIIWPPTESDLKYQRFETPSYSFTAASPYGKEGAKQHFDDMYRLARVGIDSGSS